jgi:FAD dependent oxidoreductase TIGR03364
MLFMKTSKYDLIIVGGGVLGAFHAFHALQKGLSVLLLERDSTPVGATVRNFGQIVPSGQESRWWEYGKTALSVYRNLQARSDLTIRENGSTYIASDDGEMQLLEEMHHIYAARDYPSELLSPAACLQRFPQLSSQYCKGGLHFAQELTAEPRLLISRLLAALEHDFALQYQPNTAVTHCDISGQQCLVRDARGQRYTADRVLIGSGSDFKTLFPEIFAKSAIRLCKLQMMQSIPLPQVSLPGAVLTGLTIRRYEAFHACPSYPTVCSTHPQAELERYGIHILFKQGLDSSIIIGDSHEYALPGQEESLDFGISQYLNTLMIQEAQRILDLPSLPIQQYWAGYYASHEKGIFEYQFADRIFISTGIGGKGMSTGAGYALEHLNRVILA